MNTYKKYCPNVFVAQCEEKHGKGDTIILHTKYLNTVKELISAISYNILDKTKLPSVSLYSKYLNIASMRFRLSMDECRNKYGLFTIEQWESLLQN